MLVNFSISFFLDLFWFFVFYIHAKLPELYQISGRAEVQYSSRAQRAQIQEKKYIIVQFIRYSLLQRYNSLQTY